MILYDFGLAINARKLRDPFRACHPNG